jgi:hypothetical protein
MDPLKRSLTDDTAAKLLDAWELLRTQHKEVPAQAVTVLLYVASHNPCHKQAIEEDLNLSTASCSRSINFVATDPARPGKSTDGLGLVQKYHDESNYRRFLLKLTPKGEQFIDRIKSIIYD